LAFNWFKKKKKESAEEAEHQEAEQTREIEEIIEETAPVTEVIPETPFVAEAEETIEDLQIAEATATSETPLSEKPVKNGGGFFARLKNGLAKTRTILNTNIEDLFPLGRKLDGNMLEDLEEMLITSDIGVETTLKIIENISKKSHQIKTVKDLKECLKSEFLSLLSSMPKTPVSSETKPHVVMVVGVNGVGKTTTIGKLAAKLTEKHQKGLVIAADTFRAAAVEQLSIWAERAGVGIIKHKDNADPASVAFDGISAAMARGVDTVYVDTAGRLHTKTNLMEELKKIKRTIEKKLPGAPHEILLVLDATTGQNALSQAKLFNEIMDITGIILTKLDGTAKGGIVLSIAGALQIPIQYVGVGESIEDLQEFDPEAFINALL